MKKIEAQVLAPEKSKLIIEYIIQILSGSDRVNSTMSFSNARIDNQQLCTLDIYVQENNFEKHLNLEITVEHALILYKQVLDDLLDNFLENDNIGVTKYYCIKSIGDEYFSGVDIVNLNGSKVKLNFNTSNSDFMNLVSEYTRKYCEFEEKMAIEKDNNENLRKFN